MFNNVNHTTSEISNQYKDLFKDILPEHFNHAPKFWREITEAEACKSHLFMYTPISLQYRQLLYTYDGERMEQMLPVHLYMFHDGTGIGMSSDYWSGKVRWYAFGCAHKYMEYDRNHAELHKLPFAEGRCMHNTQCIHCGHVWIYDSSD